MRESERSTELKREMEAKELVNKKLELKQMLQSMNNNVTLLEEIQGRLGVLRNKEEGVQEGIMDLLTFLKSHAGAQAVNDVIEQNVETIGGDFRDRFFEKHGEFTPSEIQLLLLLRIGLSTKEMALMKSVEPSSIRIFKHRLKIKLGLEKGQDIQSYIQNF
jgi:DNA-binding CsgD family transcriptional regulator